MPLLLQKMVSSECFFYVSELFSLSGTTLRAGIAVTNSSDCGCDWDVFVLPSVSTALGVCPSQERHGCGEVPETENENDAVCPKCGDEAAAVDEDATNKREKNANEGAAAAAAKKILEESDEVTNEDVEISETRNDQKDKKRYNESLKSSEVSSTYLALNHRRRACLFQKLKGIANVFRIRGNETEEQRQNTLNQDEEKQW